jgi:hypothetical protein
MARKPTIEELRRLLQKAGIDRDVRIYLKGIEEIDNGKNWFTDEQLVSTAAMLALFGGQNVTILTRDHDVLDQFFCLTTQLTSHYQATVFGDRYADDPSRFPAEPMPRSKETEYNFSVDDSFLVSKPVAPDRFIEWLLPAEYEPIRITCVLLTGQGDELAATPLMYIGETGMYRLLEAKGLTYGRSTDRLIGRNCHVTGLPIGCERSKLAIVRDRTYPTTIPEMYFAYLDLAHVTNHFEVIRSLKPPPERTPA